VIKYLRYFLFLRKHWNFKIAFHIIRHEINGENKYGINTTGYDKLDSLYEKGIDVNHASLYMPVCYDILEPFIQKIIEMGCNQVTDLGCGKGRALCVAGFHGIKNLRGIDISKEFCDDAIKNLENISKKCSGIKYEIKVQDAMYFEIEDDTECIFLFNPFDDVIMRGVIENIEISLESKPRRMIIVYMNPVHGDMFEDGGYNEICYKNILGHIDGKIYVKEIN